MKNIPVYDKTASYARENNELETYRASKKANMACKTAISDAIRKNYNNNTLDTKTALKSVFSASSRLIARSSNKSSREISEISDILKNAPFLNFLVFPKASAQTRRISPISSREAALANLCPARLRAKRILEVIAMRELFLRQIILSETGIMTVLLFHRATLRRLHSALPKLRHLIS